MNVAEFLVTYPVKAKLPLTANVEILAENTNRILIKINNLDEVWLDKYKKYTPKFTRVDPISSLPNNVLKMSGSAFKVLAWMKSLDSLQFSARYASIVLSMGTKTVTTALKELEKNNLIKLTLVTGVGYSVKLLNEKDLLQ